MHEKTRWAGLPVSVITAIWLAAVGAGIYFFLPSERPFEREGWSKADLSSTSSPRFAMADWLLARGTLHGKTRGEVVDLLGEPPETSYFRDWDLVYCLGPERGFIRIDNEWLAIRFGDDERVAECKIVRD